MKILYDSIELNHYEIDAKIWVDSTKLLNCFIFCNALNTIESNQLILSDLKYLISFYM